MTMTSSEQASEWTAESLRPIARWVAVPAASGRVRMEMVWAVPVVTVADATAGPRRSDTSAAA
jgi:hypothetical protein